MNLIVTRRIIGLAAVLASTLMAACGLRSTTASTETFTVYEDVPTMKLLDLGPPGNSPGDVYHFFAPLHSSQGGPVTGEVFGSKTLIKCRLTQTQTWKRAQLFCSSPLPIVRIKLWLWEQPITHRPPVNLMRASPSCARFWAVPVSTWRTRPIDQYAECGWLVHAGVYAAQVTRRNIDLLVCAPSGVVIR